ncbi:hypothetical protein ACEWY4_019832 [Coilia grayii]|uniref:UPAR/Ly6 domain-containing protein n=1 Tax=Coilia grayii TaxID=363190 RepID=A0ABD1JB59_9TELE
MVKGWYWNRRGFKFLIPTKSCVSVTHAPSLYKGYHSAQDTTVHSFTTIKMRPILTLSLLCGLLCKGAALTCYRCLPACPSCATTEPCATGSCASMTFTTAYRNGETDGDFRTCLPSEKCISGALNFGIVNATLSTKCCKTDHCNFEKTPKLNASTTANGKECFTCEGGNCTKKLPCAGNQDRCAEITAVVDGRNTILKGCAPRSICAEDFSAQLGSVAVGLRCCEGNLCNSAKSVGESLLLLLGSLLSVLLFY